VLANAEDASNGTKLVLMLPSEIGEFVWSVAFPRYEAGGAVHEGTVPSTMTFRTVPHKTSMAAWDVRSPVASGGASTVKIGMRCSAACRLTGHVIELRDDIGATVAEGALLDAPWPGTEALYWAEIPFRAPLAEGVAVFQATCSTAAVAVPHEQSTVGFSLRTTGHPEHLVTINVRDQATGASLSDVEVRLGLYMLSTNACGVATIHVPSGTYEVAIRRDGFSAKPLIVEVRGDRTVNIDAAPAPTIAEMAERIASFDGYPWG
jgi:hypothetical protein